MLLKLMGNFILKFSSLRRAKQNNLSSNFNRFWLFRRFAIGVLEQLGILWFHAFAPNATWTAKKSSTKSENKFFLDIPLPILNKVLVVNRSGGKTALKNGKTRFCDKFNFNIKLHKQDLHPVQEITWREQSSKNRKIFYVCWKYT